MNMVTKTGPGVAVIGCGAWGRNHVRTLNTLGRLVAVADAAPDNAAVAAAAAGVPARPFDEILKDDAIAAVVIATPDALHADMARRALEASKHVLVEKPMALSVADAEALAELADKRSRVLMTGHILRFHAGFRRLLTDLPGIGTISHIAARRLHLAGGAPRHALWDLGPHDLSMILAITGELPRRVAASLQCETAPGKPQVGHMALEFPGGPGADISFSNIHPVKLHQFCVAGADGQMVFEDSKPWPEKLACYRPGLAQPGSAPARDAIALEPGEPLREEAEAFIAAIEGGPVPPAGAPEAIAVIRVLAAAERAARSGNPEVP
jgi:predicted dehydrogenase